MVDQNGDGRAYDPGDEGLPEVEGPSLTITANLRKKAKGSKIEVTRRPVLGAGLEELHLAHKNRVSARLLRRSFVPFVHSENKYVCLVCISTFCAFCAL